jgi:uncharacterized OB-fold protein
MTEAVRRYPDPTPSGETQAFWDAAKEGRFLLRRCKETGKSHWYPRTLCPFTGGETEWFEASGKGHVYSFSVMRKAVPVYVMAYVTLAEGPTMMTNIVDCDPDRLRIGDPVEVAFVATANGGALPMFRPITPTEDSRP